jgi:predicted secreted protein
MPYIGNQPAPSNVGSDSITDGSIVNADINSSAAIAISKLDGVTATNTELNFVDGVTSNVQTQIDAKQPYATIAVTVVDSGGNKYALDGTVQQLGLLTPSVTYRFDQSDSSNSGHPLLLSTTSNGTHGGGSAFTTGVTAVGTPGSAGAYTQVKLEQDAPDTLYYYCTNHSGMGGEVDVRATVSSLSDLSVTATAAELNILDGVTSTAAELNILDGVTSTAAELNILDGVTATTAELNYLDIATLGLTAASKAVTADANGVVSFDNGTTEESTVVTSSSNAATINLRDGNVFTHTLSENVTYTFSNPAASGRASAFILKVVQDSSARTITWPGTVDWAAATAPTITATNAGIDVFAFITVDGGSNYYGFTLGQAMG